LDDILNRLYFDQLVNLIEQANVRKISDWKMQLAIAHNPHVKKPKDLFLILDREQKRHEAPASEVLDKSGFDRFKAQLGRSNKIIVK
jgi:hypothetical protein